MLSRPWYRTLAPFGRLALVGAALLAVLGGSLAVSAQTPAGYFRHVRTMETSELGLSHPTGLTFSPLTQALLALEEQAADAAGTAYARLQQIDLFEDPVGTPQVLAAIDPANVAFDRSGRLLTIDTTMQSLAIIPADAAGRLNTAAAHHVDLGALRRVHVRGLAVDPVSGRLFLLDASARQILVLPAAGFAAATAVQVGQAEVIRLDDLALAEPGGLAYNPHNAHLYLLDAAQSRIYELSQDGQAVSVLDLTGLALGSPQSIVFAPSGDPTDDPARWNLYLADGGTADQRGGIVELSLTEPTLVTQPQASQATLIRVIETSAWNPPSPDPMGIAYRSDTNSLFIVDSEVEEMDIYQGKNVFESSLAGGLLATCVTTDFSREPTGVAFDPASGLIYIVDDRMDRIFEVFRGNDGQYCTDDDTVKSLDTLAFGSSDPEDIAVGPDTLFVADGLAAEVYVISAGNNGVFDGVAPVGDDSVNSFDTEHMGVYDPEGVAYHAERNTLFIVSRVGSAQFLVETTLDGATIGVYDTSVLGSVQSSGLAFAPGSQDATATHLYMTDRGVDNNTDPSENDGRVYEIAFEPADISTPLYLPLIRVSGH